MKKGEIWSDHTVTTVRCRGADECGVQQEHHVTYDAVKADGGTGDGGRCNGCLFDKLITGSPLSA